MSLKTFKFPDSIPIEQAATAWGVDPEPLHKFSSTDTLTSHELRKFLMKTTEFNFPGKAKPAFKEYFVRFMVLSLKYPLIEDTEKAVLQMLERDYLKPDDENLFRPKCKAMFDGLDKTKIQDFVLRYYEKSQTDYVAQFPTRVLAETTREVPYGSWIHTTSKISFQMGLNLAICVQKMGATLALIPIVDQVSREIIESNPLAKSFAPVLGSLRMRRNIADNHTRLAVGG